MSFAKYCLLSPVPQKSGVEKPWSEGLQGMHGDLPQVLPYSPMLPGPAPCACRAMVSLQS